jgi:phosphoribosylglycinamide formyltransferase-1
MDTGPVILQEKLDILPDETADALHQRLQVIEHRIYPMAITQHSNSLSL